MEAFDTIVNKLKELNNKLKELEDKQSEQDKEYKRKYSELAAQNDALQKENNEEIRKLNEEFKELHDSIDRDWIIEQARKLKIDVEPVVLQYIRGVITAFEFIKEVQRRYEEEQQWLK